MTTHPCPTLLPDEIWIDFTEDQYGNLSLLEWSSEKDKGIKYIRSALQREDSVVEEMVEALEIISAGNVDGYGYAKQALAAHSKAEAMGGWKPISEAPRDGTRVLFYCDGDVRKGYADEYGFYIVNNGDYNDGGYGQDYQCDDKNKNKDYGYSIPTHFMHLPAAPKGVG